MTNQIVRGLRNVGLGYLFILFNFNLGTIDLIPNFVGYIFIYQGIKILLKEVESLKLLVNFAIILGGISFIEWLFAIIGANINFYIVSTFIMIMTLYFDFQLVSDIMEIAKKYHYVHLVEMKVMRNLKVIIYTIVYLMMYWFQNETILFILVCVELVVCVYLVYLIYELARYIEKNKIV